MPAQTETFLLAELIVIQPPEFPWSCNMDHQPTQHGNAANALDPIQLASVEEIIEHYPDHPLASLLLVNYLTAAIANCDGEASQTATQVLEDLIAYYRDHPHPLPMLHDRIQNDQQERIRRAAVESIAKHYSDDPQTYPWLREQAQQTEDIYVQYAAVVALGDYFSHEPQTLEFLRDLYQSDAHYEMRQIALRQIAQHFSNHPQTATLLHDCLNNKAEIANLRQEALWQIAKQYHNESQTLPLLHNCLQSNDKIFAVIVFRALAEYYKDDPQTLPALHKYARQGHQNAVSLLLNYPRHPEMFEILRDRAQLLIDGSSYDYDAFRGLVRIYTDHPQTLSMVMEVIQTRLNKRSRDNLDKSVARFGLELLMQHYSQHPDVFPFLISSVEQSETAFPDAECCMVSFLVKHHQTHPTVLPFLKQIAQNHSNSDLRTAALCSLARGYGNDPEILSFLQQCIQAEQRRERPIWIRNVMDAIDSACADNPQTLAWFKQLARDTNNSNQLRNSAIAVLSHHCDPETYQLLSDIAQHGSDARMRLNALRSLAKHQTETEGDRADQWEPIAIEVPNIPDDCGDEYVELRDLLKRQQWRVADDETYSLLKQKLGQNTGGKIRLEAMLSMSSEDVQIIDQLWTSTSRGHFGFSIQRAIYLQCGGTLDGRYPGDQVWQTFCQRVGWIVAGFLGCYEDIQFHLRAPAGHLPLWATVSEFGDCHYQHLFTEETPEAD